MFSKEKKNGFMQFEDWEAVARSGNFIIKKHTDDVLSYYAIKSANGNWMMVFRNDNTMYHVIDRFINGEDDYSNAIDVICYTSYMASSVVPDNEFVDGFTKLYEDLMKRTEGYVKKYAEGKDEDGVIFTDDDITDGIIEEAYEGLDDGLSDEKP